MPTARNTTQSRAALVKPACRAIVGIDRTSATASAGRRRIPTVISGPVARPAGGETVVYDILGRTVRHAFLGAGVYYKRAIAPTAGKRSGPTRVECTSADLHPNGDGRSGKGDELLRCPHLE